MSKTAGDIIGDASAATVPVDGVKVLLDTVIEKSRWLGSRRALQIVRP